jgi:hypothetical protein
MTGINDLSGVPATELGASVTNEVKVDSIEVSQSTKTSALGLSNEPALATEASLEESQPHPIQEALDWFLADIGSIATTANVVMPHVVDYLSEQHKKGAAILDRFKVEALADGQSMFRANGAHQASELLTTIRDLEKLKGGRIFATLQKSLFIQIFSEFDAFTGALLKVIYSKKEDLLKGISRELSFSDLLKYEDLAAIKIDMLQKEIETFRRDSYVEQFSKLEAKFGIKTLRAFPEWPEFVELSQRRNLLVHNGGRVNEQYLLMCDREGYKFKDRPDVGEALLPDSMYFARAVVITSKVGFMLTHTLWRKLFPEEVQSAHQAANSTIYEILRDKRWRTTSHLAEFSLNEQMTKSISDLDLRIRIINAAIACKALGQDERAKAHVASIDWSASYRDFKLAIAVLEDRFSDAAEIMKSIGPKGEIVSELAYHEWPLFHKFRESAEFLNAYQEIFKTSFIREVVRQSADSNFSDTVMINDKSTSAV